VVFGLIAIMFMPSTPADAKFFTEEERVVALARMHADAHGATKEQDVNKETFDWHWVRMALLSPNTIFCSLAWFFLLIPLYVSFVSLSRNVMTLTQPVILIVPADHHQRNGILECEGTTGNSPHLKVLLEPTTNFSSSQYHRTCVPSSSF
jgi:hypothetical protein